jgi:hypothetical protein
LFLHTFFSLLLPALPAIADPTGAATNGGDRFCPILQDKSSTTSARGLNGEPAQVTSIYDIYH